MNFKEEVSIYMVEDQSSETGFSLRVYPKDLCFWAHSDSICIANEEVEFDVEIPDNDELRELAIETFKGNIRHIWAEAQVKVNEEEGKIKKLQQLEHIS